MNMTGDRYVLHFAAVLKDTVVVADEATAWHGDIFPKVTRVRQQL